MGGGYFQLEPKARHLLKHGGQVSGAPLCLLPAAPRLVRGPYGPGQGQEQGGDLRQGTNDVRTGAWMGVLADADLELPGKGTLGSC